MISCPLGVCVMAAMPDWVSSAYTSRLAWPFWSVAAWSSPPPQALSAAAAENANAAAAADATSLLVAIVVSVCLGRTMLSGDIEAHNVELMKTLGGIR